MAAQRSSGTSLFTMPSRLAARAPVAVFLLGTFAWAWLLWGYWIPAMPPGGLDFSPAFLVTAIGGGFAPSLAAIATTWLIGGAPAMRKLLTPLTHWRHDAGWYVFALLLVPVIAAVSAILQALFISPLHWVDAMAILPVALVWPPLAALGEEIGWRGFMLPRLQARFGMLSAALLVGVVWGLWHLPAHWIGMKAYGDLFLAAFLINGPFVLSGHAVIMSWLWNRTRGSLLLMVLYHMSVTFSAMVMPVSATNGALGLLSAGIGAVLVWAVALYLVIRRRQDF